MQPPPAWRVRWHTAGSQTKPRSRRLRTRATRERDARLLMLCLHRRVAPSPHQLLCPGKGSEFLKQIGPENVQALVVGVRLQQPGGGRDTAQERIAILGGKTKAGDLMPITHGQSWDRHHRLVEYAPKIAMITPEGKDRIGHGFV